MGERRAAVELVPTRRSGLVGSPSPRHSASRSAFLASLADEIRQQAFSHIVLLGMGGSSLGPEVFAETFERQRGWPALLVLDSTDPAQIRTIESRIDPARTLFIVSSKSGSTLEPNILKQYFFECVKRAVGADTAGSRFIAITDPGSSLQKIAERDRFRHIAFGIPSIGGRYSVLSDFGLVPGGCDGARYRQAARATADDGALRVARMCQLRIIRASRWGPFWVCWESQAATRSPSLPPPVLPISGHGSNNYWLN